jgi:hypothetical protein
MPHSHALPHTSHATALSRWVIVGFLSGAISVLIFHQGAVAIFHALAFTSRQPWVMQATAPFGVPQVWSLAFWGGVWGVLLAVFLARLETARFRFLVAATVFGAVLPTLVAWFVVAPLKGQPLGGGFAPAGIALALVANGLWGLGAGIGLALFGRRRRD